MKQRKGKKFSSEHCESIRNSRLNKKTSEETKNAISESISKLKWVNDGSVQRRVKFDSIEPMIHDGWKLGRLK